MATRLYKLSEDALVPVEPGRLAKEEMIQDWIARQPELLGLDLLIIGREVVTAHGGWIDLLGIDEEGNLAILELKRDRTPRDTIGQVLDYASWVVNLKTADVQTIAFGHLGKTLNQAFQDRFKTDLPETLNESHIMVIIASQFDPSSQRIVRYLSQRGIAINTAFFTVFDEDGQTFLTTDWLLDESEVAERSDGPGKMTEAELLTVANDLKITKLVEICRELSKLAVEKPSRSYGGSFRYWFKDKMIVGVNVAGGRRGPPPGELDVWMPVTKLSELVAIPQENIREVLKRDFATTERGITECVIRLKSPEEAQKLVAHIREWITTPVTADAPH
jgi:hypothetical protein